MMSKLFKISRVVAICLLFFTGVNALIAGFLFISDPNGGKIGMTTSYLAHSPFKDFLIPGLTLFIVNGLMNIVVAVLVLKNYRHFPILILIQGVLLSGWIIVQVFLVKDVNALHSSMLAIGFALCICGILLKHQFKNVSSPETDFTQEESRY